MRDKALKMLLWAALLIIFLIYEYPTGNEWLWFHAVAVLFFMLAVIIRVLCKDSSSYLQALIFSDCLFANVLIEFVGNATDRQPYKYVLYSGIIISDVLTYYRKRGEVRKGVYVVLIAIAILIAIVGLFIVNDDV